MDSFRVQPPLLIDFHHFQLSRHKPNPHKREATPRPSCSPHHPPKVHPPNRGGTLSRHFAVFWDLGRRRLSTLWSAILDLGLFHRTCTRRTGTPNRQAPAKDEKKRRDTSTATTEGRGSPGLDFGPGRNTCAFTSYLH
ncbi:hypothetical protein GE21DRAFT_1305365 [Neurospora crassa]|nr:hypothetical protein 1A9.270 [imported] - Neurospora crassa [Neurospora crassa]KHE88368.1 hypothetical protein GE21DRAFT_1305365 [Neurospora crassa]